MDNGIGGYNAIASHEMRGAIVVSDTTASLEDDEGAT